MAALVRDSAADVISLQRSVGAKHPGSSDYDQQSSVSDVSDKSLDKKRAKEKKRLASEFTQEMNGTLQALESTMQQGTPAQKELAKQRRRMLKDVLKAATEPSSSVDERLRYLQHKFVQLIQEQAKQDKDTLTLQAQLDVAEKQAALGQADLQRANQKADRLQHLARTMQKENKLLGDEAQLRQQQLEHFRKATQAISEKIENHSSESTKLLEVNTALHEENQNLRSKLSDMGGLLTDTQEKLEMLRTAQTEQLQSIQDKLGQQTDFIQRSQELQDHMSRVLQENKLLAEQVTALDLQNKQLDKVNAEYKQQLGGCRSQMKDMESSLTASNKLMKLVDKLQHDMAEHQKQMPILTKENALLHEQNMLLQRQVRQQVDELKRSQLQKLRLEGLCRALQARLGGGTAIAAAAAAAKSRDLDDAAAAAAGDDQHRTSAEAESDDEIAAACSRLVAAAFKSVFASN